MEGGQVMTTITEGRWVANGGGGEGAGRETESGQRWNAGGRGVMTGCILEGGAMFRCHEKVRN